MQHNVETTTQSIALLNDQARTTLTNCKLIITKGIDLLGNEAVGCILNLVRRFDDFSEGNTVLSYSRKLVTARMGGISWRC